MLGRLAGEGHLGTRGQATQKPPICTMNARWEASIRPHGIPHTLSFLASALFPLRQRTRSYRFRVLPSATIPEKLARPLGDSQACGFPRHIIHLPCTVLRIGTGTRPCPCVPSDRLRVVSAGYHRILQWDGAPKPPSPDPTVSALHRFKSSSACTAI